LPLKTIDVAIGIALLYLMLTFAASAFVEIVSTICNWRAEMLHDAIMNMLGGSRLLCADDIYGNPLIQSLGRKDAAKSWLDFSERFGWRPHGTTPPSYIPPAAFSAAVLEGILNRSGTMPALSPEGMIKLLQSLLEDRTAEEPDQLHHDALRSLLETTLITQGGSIQAVRFAIEKWFNDTMDRASGWYKRRTQSFLLLIGLIIAFSCNVDSIGVARWLWAGDAARQAVVTAATEYVRSNPLPPVSQPINSSAADSPPKDLNSFASQLVTLDRRINSLQYPIGWPPAQSGFRWIAQYLLGGIITAIAISMGSTFWFDAIQSLIQIRGTGPKPSAR
jgi:hypothetical protein